jgi:hypothetical protein
MINTVSLISGEVSDESAQTALDEGTLTARKCLRVSATNENFLIKFVIAFGNSLILKI